MELRRRVRGRSMSASFAPTRPFSADLAAETAIGRANLIVSHMSPTTKHRFVSQVVLATMHISCDEGCEGVMTMRRWQKLATAWPILAVLTPVACTGSPATLSMRPDFEVTTSVGTASVSIREPLPGLTYDESERLLRAGMASVTRVSSDGVSMVPP
jgi:hypothetical protein